MSDQESYDIDPAAAMEILPKKIEQRRSVIQELLIDLSVAKDSPFASADEIASMEKSIAAQRSYLKGYEDKLEAIRKAANS